MTGHHGRLHHGKWRKDQIPGLQGRTICQQQEQKTEYAVWVQQLSYQPYAKFNGTGSGYSENRMPLIWYIIGELKHQGG